MRKVGSRWDQGDGGPKEAPAEPRARGLPRTRGRQADGMDLGLATCGRILALNRKLYGLEAHAGTGRPTDGTSTTTRSAADIPCLRLGESPLKLRRSFRGSEDPAEPFLVASLEGIGDTKAPRRLHTYVRSFRPALASLVSVKRADRMATWARRTEVVSVILLWHGNPTHQKSSPSWEASDRERNGGEAPHPGARSYKPVTRRRSGEPVTRGSSDPVRCFVASSPRSRFLPPREPARGLRTSYSQVRVIGFQRSALASSRRIGSTNSETCCTASSKLSGNVVARPARLTKAVQLLCRAVGRVSSASVRGVSWA